ncbi:hypothetical protein [Saccharomonospora glauca]|uniref:Uncharacterized protein n=1 Tax=Saccharomonospora glauca K62 TaxID=928724 RepID=I1CZY1_9PSEU|nr:hypothetical protein [Saccharomonospora glauca]EIE98255.1 hypothetical protein SacglDRAFT_01332 [Saccharomonospora glauca K62]
MTVAHDPDLLDRVSRTRRSPGISTTRARVRRVHGTSPGSGALREIDGTLRSLGEALAARADETRPGSRAA